MSNSKEKQPLLNNDPESEIQHNFPIEMESKKGSGCGKCCNNTNNIFNRVKKLIFREGKLGMYRGVVMPTVLNIFGVILFLRLGLVVGQCGFWGAILEFVVAYGVTGLTTLSIAAICTNGRIEGGGAYYMLSRSIGPEIGGACGIVFWLGAVAGACTYVMGFAESLVQAFPMIPDDEGHWWRLLYGSAALLILFIVCFIGAEMFADANFIIFVIVVVSMVFLIICLCIQEPFYYTGFTSFSWETFVGNFRPTFGLDPEGELLNPFKLFGIMFPACTGIMAGVNLSGDLKNPKKDIPYGTIIAVVFTFVCYIFILFILSFTTQKEALLSDYTLTAHISYFPLLISFGVFAASLSSCLSNMIGASRVLQAVAKDKLIPFISIFGKGCGKNDEPRFGVAFTYLVIQVIIILVTAVKGDLNVTAPFATQFHIVAYGFTNFACFILKVSGAPNFRPLFKYWSWHTALIGTVLCILTMFFCDPYYGISAGVSCVILVILMIIIHFYAKPKDWGHITQAIIYHQVRKYLLMLDNRKDNTKFWRFQPLLLVSNPRSCVPTIHFVNNLKKGGTFIIGSVKIGTFDDHLKDIKSEREAWLEFVTEQKIKAFPEIAVGGTIREGAQNLMMIGGIGAMKPNGVILGFFDPREAPEQKSFVVSKSLDEFPQIRSKESNMTLNEYISIINDAVNFEKSVLIAKDFHTLNKELLKPKSFVKKIVRSKERYIDLWIRNGYDWKEHSTILTLQLGNMINRVDLWNKYHKLRIFAISYKNKDVEGITKSLKDLLHEYRIQAEVCVVSVEKDQKGIDFPMLKEETQVTIFNEIMRSYSKVDGDMVENPTSFIFTTLPLPPQNSVNNDEYINMLEKLTDGLPPVLLIHGSNNVISIEL